MKTEQEIKDIAFELYDRFSDWNKYPNHPSGKKAFGFLAGYQHCQQTELAFFQDKVAACLRKCYRIVNTFDTERHIPILNDINEIMKMISSNEDGFTIVQSDYK